MAYELKVVAEKDYIEFKYVTTNLFEVMKMNSELYASMMLAQGKIKDTDAFTLSDDNVKFFNYSCKAAMEKAFGLMAQLSREIKNIIECTVFDIVNEEVILRVGYKSTINEASLSSWDSAIEDYMIAYVLRDWYSICGFPSDAALPAKTKILYDIAYARSISDLKWLAVGTVEEARINLEESMYEYIDESLVTQ